MVIVIKLIFREKYNMEYQTVEILNKSLLSKEVKKINTSIKNKNQYYNQFLRHKNLINSSHYSYLFLFIILCIFTLFSKANSLRRIQLEEIYCDSVIILTIRGSGIQNIISEDANDIPLPQSLKINNNNINSSDISKTQYLPDENNIVIMAWASPLITCRNMFKGLYNIIEIDLSNFDFSLVTDIGSFFDWCTSLQSINMNNGNGTLIENADYMCSHCSSLITIDLTNFRSTSLKSVKGMFFGCIQLQSINMNKFEMSQAIDMEELFAECYSIQSLNLSNFITPLLTNMRRMFYLCYNLKVLDINNFQTDKVTNMEELFKE